jgi:hypothetical protein
MSLRQACGLLALLFAGCGESLGPHVVVEQTVTVKTADNEKQSIPLGELYDPRTGEPAFPSVLVIDRQTDRETFISLDQLTGQTQANARYMLVTASDNAGADTND